MHGMVMAARYDDLHAVVELLKYVENTGLASGAPEMGSPLLGISNYTKHLVDAFYEGPPQLQKQHADLIAKASVGYSAELQKYGLDNNIPYWVLNLKFYGPPRVIQAQWEAVQELAEKSIKGVRFQAGQIQSDPRKASAEWTVYPQDVGVPNMDFFGMGTRAGGNPHPMRGHMWFSPVIPQTAQGILEANRVFEEAYRTLPALQNVPIWNLRPFALPAPFFERAFLFIVGFPITDDASMNKASIKAYRTLLDIGAQHGWGEYRCHPEFQDQAMGLYSYNNNSLLRLSEVIKDAIDPNGILSPGRYGIWPRHLRKGAQ
jgi:4-cresol dehydrogenase (hydroxylating)